VEKHREEKEGEVTFYYSTWPTQRCKFLTYPTVKSSKSYKKS
jgi:hypothetical protein